MAAEKDIDKVVQAEFFPENTGGGGVLVEVGAARPDYLSIGASFRARGWKVISIEPNPEFCELHRAQGHDVLQYACSEEDRDNVDFYVVNSNNVNYLDGNVSFESFSSLGIKDEFAESLETAKFETNVGTIKVNVRKLDTILAEHHPEVTSIDVIAVDVEGWELSVMRGLTLEKYRPKVVILENLFKSRSYIKFMRQHGYKRWKRLKPNEIYIRKEEKSTSLGSFVHGLFGRKS